MLRDIRKLDNQSLAVKLSLTICSHQYDALSFCHRVRGTDVLIRALHTKKAIIIRCLASFLSNSFRRLIERLVLSRAFLILEKNFTKRRGFTSAISPIHLSDSASVTRQSVFPRNLQRIREKPARLVRSTRLLVLVGSTTD